MKLGHIIDTLIFGYIGASFLLMSLGKMRVSKDPEANARWRGQWGLFMGVVGAVLLGAGIYHLFRVFQS